jgi:hypothetical protein
MGRADDDFKAARALIAYPRRNDLLVARHSLTTFGHLDINDGSLIATDSQGKK